MSLAVRQAQNVSGQAVKFQNTSSILKETASKTEDKVDNELSSLLDDIKKRLELIRAKIRNVSNDLAGVQGNFLEFDDMAGRIGKCSLCVSLWPLVYPCTTTTIIMILIMTLISDNSDDDDDDVDDDVDDDDDNDDEDGFDFDFDFDNDDDDKNVSSVFSFFSFT